MQGVLQEAVFWAVSKLAFSLVLLPRLAAPRAATLCCCCLLLFTDLLSAGFLAVLWASQLSLGGDVIALRLLLFLGHTYGLVLLLTTPLIAVETAARLLTEEELAEEELTVELAEDELTVELAEDELKVELTEDELKVEIAEDELTENEEHERRGSVAMDAAGYMCCLAAWLCSGLRAGRAWRREEPWARACVGTSDSLLACLPGLLSWPGPAEPCWALVVLLPLPPLVLLALRLDQAHAAHGRRPSARRHHGPALGVVPPRRRGDTATGRGKAAGGRGHHGGAPCLGVRVGAGLLCGVSVCLLPLSLSVNVLLMLALDSALHRCIRWLMLLQGASGLSPPNQACYHRL